MRLSPAASVACPGAVLRRVSSAHSDKGPPCLTRACLLEARRSQVTEPWLALRDANGSPHEVQRQEIDGGTSVRDTARLPWHWRCAGRRAQGSPLTHLTPASPAVAARTMNVRWFAIRRAGPGASGGISTKWRRSETNTRR